MHLSKGRTLLMAAAVVAAAVGALALEAVAGRGDRGSGSAAAVMHDAQGRRIGTVTLLPAGEKVRVRAALASLPSGFHGFHVHAVGRCEPPFTSAGGHLNPAGTAHGAHAGDMPVLLVNRDGTARGEFVTDRFRVADLLDADGSALIVHAAADNYANVPSRYHSHTEDTFGPDSATLATGDSGTRIACGVVQTSRGKPTRRAGRAGTP